MAVPVEAEVRLIQRAARGDPEAFRPLFETHFQPVYHYALILSGEEAFAEDLTQEAFIRAHAGLARFGPPWKLRSWLLRTIHNLFLDRVRQGQSGAPL